MSDARAIQASFADWRTVKSRKVLQLVFEIPLEGQTHVLNLLGAPMPDSDTWCAIALLKPQTVKEPSQAAKLPSELSSIQLSQQAFFLCQNEAFKSYLLHRFGADDPAAYIRLHCSVASRADIIPGTPAAEKFYHLRAEFDIWRRAI